MADLNLDLVLARLAARGATRIVLDLGPPAVLTLIRGGSSSVWSGPTPAVAIANAERATRPPTPVATRPALEEL